VSRPHSSVSPALALLSLFPGLPPPDRTHSCPWPPARAHAMARPPSTPSHGYAPTGPPIPLLPRVPPVTKGEPSDPPPLFSPRRKPSSLRAHATLPTFPHRATPHSPPVTRATSSVESLSHRRHHGRTVVSSLPPSPRIQIPCASPPPPPHLAAGPT
jgi:hypothetical protein